MILVLVAKFAGEILLSFTDAFWELFLVIKVKIFTSGIVFPRIGFAMSKLSPIKIFYFKLYSNEEKF